METRRLEADGQDYMGLERGWCFGAEEFRRELLGQEAPKTAQAEFGLQSPLEQTVNTDGNTATLYGAAVGGRS